MTLRFGQGATRYLWIEESALWERAGENLFVNTGGWGTCEEQAAAL